ncbi:MBL fold metallo-hydrolase [Pseudomonas aeruginosa]
MFSIQMLPAREGDAIWVRWGEEEAPYQMLVDTGTEEVGRVLSQKIGALPESQRNFEAVVVTHVDADHIGGGC